LSRGISAFTGLFERISGFFLLYAFTFICAYWIHFYKTRYYWPVNHSFYWLLFFAAILFALKISIHDSASLFTQHLMIPGKILGDKSRLAHKNGNHVGVRCLSMEAIPF
jgi:hypothetical protein